MAPPTLPFPVFGERKPWPCSRGQLWPADLGQSASFKLFIRKLRKMRFLRYIRRFAEIIFESAVHLLKRLQRASDLVRHALRNEGAEPGRSAADRLMGELAIGFLVLWLGLRALRRRLGRLKG